MSLRPEHDERRFVVFYQDYRKGGLGSIKPEEGVSLGVTDLQARMGQILQRPRNFFGVVDPSGKIV